MESKEKEYQSFRRGSLNGTDDEFDRNINIAGLRRQTAVWIWRGLVVALFISMNILPFLAFKKASNIIPARG